MNELDAPLGKPSLPRKRKAAPEPGSDRHSGRGDTRGGFASAFVIFACAAIIGLNAYVLTVRDPLPQSAPIMLTVADTDGAADLNPVTGSVETPPVSEDTDSGVQVVYGSAGAETADAPNIVPAPRPEENGARISENGPKMIMVRDPSAASVGQPQQVAHLPDELAIEPSEWGDLPVRTDDGRRPMDIYARPWSQAGGKRIAIVIGGLGLSQTGTQHAISELPPEITLAFSPEGNSLNRWMRAARKNGHELLVQVPMEPFNYPQNDPGPQTLQVAAAEEDNLENLRWALGQLTNYTGIVNFLGARFASDEAAISPVLREIGQRGLLYMNDGTAGGQRLGELARAYDVPYVAGNVVLDTSQDPAEIRTRLKQLEGIAEAAGFAIGSGSALQPTVDTVAAWANDAKKRGFEIVGVSALAR
jgi:polysaccharide deacetylase 2 family uncharacterized protein YibQ